MRASVAALLVLVFLAAPCVAVKPTLSSDDVIENSWASKAPMQVARSSLGVAVVNDKIYAIGGTTENGVVNTNEEYNPVSDTWTYKKPMPTPRENFAITSYQNKIYCVGGSLNNGTATEANEV